MTSKSEVNFCAVFRAVMTRLAIVPASFSAGKKIDRPAGRLGASAAIVGLNASMVQRFKTLGHPRPTKIMLDARASGRAQPPCRVRLSQEGGNRRGQRRPI